MKGERRMKNANTEDIVISIIAILSVISVLTIPVVAILVLWNLMSGVLAAKIVGTAVITLLVNMAIVNIIG